jgi:hypothetical protein
MDQFVESGGASSVGYSRCCPDNQHLQVEQLGYNFGNPYCICRDCGSLLIDHAANRYERSGDNTFTLKPKFRRLM